MADASVGNSNVGGLSSRDENADGQVVVNK